MIFKNEDIQGIVIDTLSYNPYIPDMLTETYVTSGIVLGHWKVNNSLTYIDDNNIEKKIAIKNDNGTLKTKEQIYELLTTWELETLFNAFFNKDFEAGNIKGGGEEIESIVIKRLSPTTGYMVYEPIGTMPYIKGKKKIAFKDYLIASGEVYMYAVQPVTVENHFGAMQNKVAGLNRYDTAWIIDSTGVQIKILNLTIEGAVSLNTRDGVMETIGRRTPIVNRLAGLDYKSFTIKGIIASEFDDYDHIRPEIEESVYGGRADFKKLIDDKYLEKTGMLPTDVSNSMRIDTNFERKFRDKVADTLKNGQEKVLKTHTEGLLLVKLTNVQLLPIKELNRVIYEFTAQATETGTFETADLKRFSFNESLIVED